MDIRFDTQIVDVSVALTALKHYRAGNYKQAIESLLQILDGEPENWDARLMLAASYYKTSQFAAAERAFALLNEKCPDKAICTRAQVGLKASTARLHNRDIADEKASVPVAPLPVVPTLMPQSGSVLDTTQSNFLSWLDKRDDVVQ